MKLSLTLVALLMGVSLSATAQPAAAQPTASQPATAQLVAAQPANGTAESSQGASASAPAPKTAAEETAASKTVAAKTSDAETTVSKTSDPKAPAEKTPASKAPATETTADESMAPFAQEGNAAALAPAQAEAITKAFEARFPGIHVDRVRTTPMQGLYEVQVGMDLLYTDASVDYVLQGSLIDAKAKKDLTAERLETLQQVAFDTLPLKDAIKIVKGNGARKLATFEDPNCPYCKQLHHTLASVDNVTVYVFLYPILTPDSMSKSRDIWCAPDPAKAWMDWMVGGKAPAASDCKKTPLQANLALGRKLNVQGTPALFFGNGVRVNGALPLASLQDKLDAQGKG
ncbi:hypothetical protein CDEF62S_03706 [Castellaniella defragrans]